MGNIIINVCAWQKWPVTIWDCLATLVSAPGWRKRLMASSECAVMRDRTSCNSLDGSQCVFVTEVRSAPLGVRLSARILMTKFGSHIYKGPAVQGLIIKIQLTLTNLIKQIAVYTTTKINHVWTLWLVSDSINVINHRGFNKNILHCILLRCCCA